MGAEQSYLSTWATDLVEAGGTMGMEEWLAGEEGKALLMWAQSSVLARREEGLDGTTRQCLKELRAFVIAVKTTAENQGKYAPCGSKQCVQLHKSWAGAARGFCGGGEARGGADSVCMQRWLEEQQAELRRLSSGTNKWRDLRLLHTDARFVLSRGFLTSRRETRSTFFDVERQELRARLEEEIDAYRDACRDVWQGNSNVCVGAGVGDAGADSLRVSHKARTQSLRAQYESERHGVPQDPMQQRGARIDIYPKATEPGQAVYTSDAQGPPDSVPGHMEPPHADTDIQDASAALTDHLEAVYRAARSAVVLLFRGACEIARASGGYGISWAVKPVHMAWLEATQYDGAGAATAVAAAAAPVIATPLQRLRRMTFTSCRIVFDRISDLVRAVRAVAEDFDLCASLGFRLVNVQNRLGSDCDEAIGLRDVVLHIDVGGHICEVQLLLRPLLDVALHHGIHAPAWIRVLRLVRETGYVGGLNGSGERHGSGARRLHDGSWYAGEWCHGQPHGHGLMWLIRAAGTEQREGEWRNGKMEGAGRIVRADGTVFMGYLVDGLPHGAGCERMWWGATFEGHWVTGKRNGPGVCVLASGERKDPDIAGVADDGGDRRANAARGSDETTAAGADGDSSSDEDAELALTRGKRILRDVVYNMGLVTKNVRQQKGSKADEMRTLMRGRVRAAVRAAALAVTTARRFAQVAPQSWVRIAEQHTWGEVTTATDALLQHGVRGGLHWLRARQALQQEARRHGNGGYA